MQVLVQLVPIILMFVLLYFLMIVPDKKRRKQYESMLDNLKVNDEIMTKGGIIGRIITIDEENIILETGPSRARIKLSKNGIGQVLNSREEEQAKEESKKNEELPMAKEVKEEK